MTAPIRKGATKSLHYAVSAVTLTDFSSDITILTTYGMPAYGLYVNTTGTIVVKFADSDTAVSFFIAVAGTFLPIQPVTIESAADGTTVTSVTIMFPEARV